MKLPQLIIHMTQLNSISNNILDLTDPVTVTILIDGCKRGDRKIQEILYKEMYSGCMSIALRYTDNKVDAEDVLSIAFTKVFNKINTIDTSNHRIAKWIRTIVINTALDHIRKYNKTSNMTCSIDETYTHGLGDTYSPQSRSIYIDETFSESIDGEYIMKIIQELPPCYRTVFNLSVFEGLTHKQIATKLGINEGTSKSNLSKARMKLRDKLIKLQEDDELSILTNRKYEYS